MSLYNMVNGFNPACIFFLPMLGRKAEDYPRFRDCFLSEDNQKIAVYTRVGGGNRNCGYGEEKLYDDENFIRTFDDDFDNTYATYEFKVPDRWRADFDKLVAGNTSDVSDEYVALVSAFYPKLAEHGKIAALFGRSSTSDTEATDAGVNHE